MVKRQKSSKILIQRIVFFDFELISGEFVGQCNTYCLDLSIIKHHTMMKHPRAIDITCPDLKGHRRLIFMPGFITTSLRFSWCSIYNWIQQTDCKFHLFHVHNLIHNITASHNCSSRFWNQNTQLCPQAGRTCGGSLQRTGVGRRVAWHLKLPNCNGQSVATKQVPQLLADLKTGWIEVVWVKRCLKTFEHHRYLTIQVEPVSHGAMFFFPEADHFEGRGHWGGQIFVGSNYGRRSQPNARIQWSTSSAQAISFTFWWLHPSPFFFI